MSRAHEFHQPNAPDSSGDDSDSDIELHLNELGPHNVKGGYDPNGPPHWDQQSPESRIPLRSLRVNRIRGSGGSPQDDGYGGGRDSEGTVEDSAPLLEAGDDSNAKSELPEDSRRPSSRLRLARFFSSATAGSPTEAHEARDSSTAGASRNITIGQYPPPRFPPNAVSNAKYTAWSFLPRTLYNEFSFFFNMYFLLVALSQLIPPLRIGYVSTYVVPLVFVLSITLGKEALDDIARRRRDAEANKEAYTVLRLRHPSTASGRKGRENRRKQVSSKGFQGNTTSSHPSRLDVIEEEEERLGVTGKDSKYGVVVDELRIRSRDIKVGDVVKLGKDQRVPADLVILKSSSAESGVAPSLPQPSDISHWVTLALGQMLVDSLRQTPLRRSLRTQNQRGCKECPHLASQIALARLSFEPINLTARRTGNFGWLPL